MKSPATLYTLHTNVSIGVLGDNGKIERGEGLISHFLSGLVLTSWLLLGPIRALSLPYHRNYARHPSHNVEIGMD